jgi:predicted NBD/HSP70 family sugar kinase
MKYVMARRQLLKDINRAHILNTIKTHGAIARANIADLTGLSPATVTGLTNELINDGLILEKEEGASRGGRPPILLALDSTNVYVVGIKLAEEHAALVLANLNAEIVARHTLPLADRVPENISDQLAKAVWGLLHPLQVGRERLIGVGVGLAGIIDAAAGVCRVSPLNGWRDVPFARLLEERLGCLVALDNNVNALTLMELLYGAGQPVRDFLVITLGRGVGLGIVANGQVYRGARGGGGEFGHTVIDPDGFLCNCGNRGCLETFVAEPWLIRRAQLQGLAVVTADALLTEAQRGQPVAVSVYERAGRLLGQSLANLVNLFNPAMILISGEGVRAGDWMFGAMRDALHRHTFGQLAQDMTLKIAPLNDDAWARGAASLVLNRIFSVPELD